VNATAPVNPTLSDLAATCAALGRRARAAARELATVTTDRKDAWLRDAAATLESHAEELLAANAQDLAAAEANGLIAAQIDRLRLTPSRLRAAADGLRQVAALPDPVGRVIEGGVRPNGLRVTKVGVPLGVILFLYESRPNVTVDAAALAVKSGNALILRGGKEALYSNTALHRLLQNELRQAGLPADAVQLVDTPDRAAVGHLLKLRELIDLVIPRGGEALIRSVAEKSRIPVIRHYKGNCHVYVDEAADAIMARTIVVNAKTQRPATCNAAEKLLIHEKVAEKMLPQIAERLLKAGVKLRGDAAARRLVPDIKAAGEEDWSEEYLDLIMAVKVVKDVDEAIRHINAYGSAHTDAIVTANEATARRFLNEVDSSSVMWNCSTRLADGGQYGLGAEIGISTGRLHARGPMGAEELTCLKWVVTGNGELRQ
jgi:glutamate-5-semialdehyde dehydrogenase